MAEATKHNLAKARDVYINNVHAGNSFLFKDAMILVGIAMQLAKTDIYQQKVKAMVDFKLDGICLDHPPDHQSRLDRFDNLCGVLFSIVGRKPSGIAQLMRMAGYPDDQIKAGKEYQQCKRRVDKKKKELSTNPPETSNRHHPNFKQKRRAWNHQGWKPADEAYLQRLKRGEVTTIQETAIFGRSLKAEDEFIATELLTMSQERYEQLSSYVYANMSEEKRRFDDQRQSKLNQLTDSSDASKNDEPVPSSAYDDEVFGDDDTLVEYEGTEELEVPLYEPSDKDDQLSRGNEGPPLSGEEEFEMVQDSEDEVSVESRRNIDKAAICDWIVEIKDILERHVRLCNAQDLYDKGEDSDFEHFKVLIESRGAKLGRAKALPTLLKKWEKIAEDNKVSEEDIESLEPELNELSQKMEK
jgi:hypothetical protein